MAASECIWITDCLYAYVYRILSKSQNDPGIIAFHLIVMRNAGIRALIFDYYRLLSSVDFFIAVNVRW